MTPSYQWKLYFIRPEFSYLSAGDYTAGSVFGSKGTTSDQFRFMVETGVVF